MATHQQSTSSNINIKRAPAPQTQGPGYQKPKKRNLRNWCNLNYKSVIQLRTRNCTCVIGLRARQNAIFIRRYISISISLRHGFRSVPTTLPPILLQLTSLPNTYHYHRVELLFEWRRRRRQRGPAASGSGGGRRAGADAISIFHLPIFCHRNALFNAGNG